MKAIGYYRPLPIDNPNALVDLDLPAPALRPRDLLVRVEAISVNPVDVTRQRRAAGRRAAYPEL